MMWRLKDVPKYTQAESRVQARDYNTVRLALRRLPGPIILQLKDLSHMNMILDEDSWVCVDSSLNDLPIIAWTDFQAAGRANLHEPVRCLLSYYHYQAGALVTKALDSTREQLSRRMAAPHRDSDGPPTRRRYGTAERELFVIT
ncbi:hypothetical protein Tel_03270 [Candidatus Tenderia electrophaga]|jgi:hypothetical protein|uniref:Uncharacterized protein n=1 Tax=Candidatus Tenderia electrophaga TaxID=1748243 RepID=A0A0S2TAW1_9GAMM|nr:hypothetical protein Tel_03270 [Candidatus Tenderia electrophaga]